MWDGWEGALSGDGGPGPGSALAKARATLNEQGKSAQGALGARGSARKRVGTTKSGAEK
jgi:hypothetical protein